MLSKSTATRVGLWEIITEAWDQMNDYSVVHDYRVTIRRHGERYGRTWHVGTDPSVAARANALCVTWATKQGG